MKRKHFLVTAGFLFCIFSGIYAAEETNYQNYELDLLLHEIDTPRAPVVTEKYIIFTAETNHRYVGIAFDFEDYKIVHPFQILTSTDEEGITTRKHMFYCFERSHKFSSLRYRLVIDGLWTTDPLNPNKEYDENVNLYFSRLENLGNKYIYTDSTKNNSVHFVHKGKSGQKINLAGTFTNWDPWIYELTETSPGLYELELPLPKGRYYYNYYIGLTPMLDETNSNKIYTQDGRSASVIEVK